MEISNCKGTLPETQAQLKPLTTRAENTSVDSGGLFMDKCSNKTTENLPPRTFLLLRKSDNCHSHANTLRDSLQDRTRTVSKAFTKRPSGSCFPSHIYNRTQELDAWSSQGNSSDQMLTDLGLNCVASTGTSHLKWRSRGAAERPL